MNEQEWAANRDVKGINQALALGWIAIIDETVRYPRQHMLTGVLLLLISHAMGYASRRTR
jgi:hypothetical protein